MALRLGMLNVLSVRIKFLVPLVILTGPRLLVHPL
jgi:hypothetical protein